MSFWLRLLGEILQLNRGDRYGLTPLYYAADRGKLETVGSLLKRGANVNAGRTKPLPAAADRGHIEIVTMLLAAGANIMQKDVALGAACLRGHAAIVKLLLDNKADPCSKKKDGFTPLHHAAAEGNNEIIHLLLDAGADPNARNKSGKTPLDYAIMNQHPQTVDLLRKLGVTLTIHGAAAAGDTTAVSSLLAAGTDVNALDGDGRTPLYIAAWRGHAEVVKMLLRAGGDPDIPSPMGGTPLWQATGQGHVEVCKVLQRAGAAEAKRRRPKAPVTFSPHNAPPMFLTVSKEFVDHLTDKFVFDESPWDYIAYDLALLNTGMPGEAGRDYRPGATQSSLELKRQANQDLLRGKRSAGRALSDYSFCIAMDDKGIFWIFAQDDHGACSVDTVWNLAVTLLSLSDGGCELTPENSHMS